MKVLFWTALVWTYATIVFGQQFQCPPGMLCIPAPGGAVPRPAIQEFITPGNSAPQPFNFAPPQILPVEDETFEVNFRQRNGLFGRRQTIQIIVQNRQPAPVYFQQPPAFLQAPPQFAGPQFQQYAPPAYQPAYQPQQFAPPQFEPRLQWQPSAVCFGGQCYPLR
jgi:hypothetical protein